MKNNNVVYVKEFCKKINANENLRALILNNKHLSIEVLDDFKEMLKFGSPLMFVKEPWISKPYKNNYNNPLCFFAFSLNRIKTQSIASAFFVDAPYEAFCLKSCLARTLFTKNTHTISIENLPLCRGDYKKVEIKDIENIKNEILKLGD